MSLLSAADHQLKKHWNLLSAALNEVLPGTHRISADDTSSYGAFAHLEGLDARLRNVCAERQRRPNIPVVPLRHESADCARLWVSWTEEWRQVRAGRPRLFQYAHTNVSVYFGEAAVDKKLQLFRIEWAGVESIADGRPIFQGKWAAHPHWQFDVHKAQHERILEQRKYAEDLERLFSRDGAEEFSPETDLSSSLELSERALLNWLTRFHFACHAGWAQMPWDGDEDNTCQHAHSPRNFTEIRNWVLSSLAYIQREAKRL